MEKLRNICQCADGRSSEPEKYETNGVQCRLFLLFEENYESGRKIFHKVEWRIK